jgi:hypothetical protein
VDTPLYRQCPSKPRTIWWSPRQRICPSHFAQNGTRAEYPPCHLVWSPVPRRSWPSIILRRATMIPDGTRVEALAIINYSHDTAPHRTPVVSTTRWDIHPNTGVPSHDSAPLGNILLSKSADLSGFHKIRTHPRKLSCHASYLPEWINLTWWGGLLH